jgi:hypothetical protein
MGELSPEGFTMFRGHWYEHYAARVVEVEYPLSSIERARKDDWPSLRERGELQLGAVEYAARRFLEKKIEARHRRVFSTYLNYIFLDGYTTAGLSGRTSLGPDRAQGFQDWYGRCLFYINRDGDVLLRVIVNHIDRITEHFGKLPGTDPEAVEMRVGSDEVTETLESLHQNGLEYAAPPEVVDLRPDVYFLPLDHEDTVEGAEDITLYF